MKAEAEDILVVDHQDFGAVVVELYNDGHSAVLKSGGNILAVMSETETGAVMNIDETGRLVAKTAEENPIESLASALEYTLGIFGANDPGKNVDVKNGARNPEFEQSLRAVQQQFSPQIN